MRARANPYFEPLKVNFKNRPNAGLTQADEILQKFRDSGVTPCGITYSANSNQTAKLNAFYADPANNQKWQDVITAFTGQGGQGPVMLDLLNKIPEDQRTNFRILPITTMAAPTPASPTGGPTTPQQLQADLTNVSTFINNDFGRVFAWQNEDNTADAGNHFAIGGGVAAQHGFVHGSPGSKYVENYFDSLQASSTANQDPPAVPAAPPHLPATKQEAEEQRKRDNEDANNKKIAALKEDWAQHNSRTWTNIKNAAALAAAATAPVILNGNGRDVKEYELGYYKLDGDKNNHLAILHLFQDPRSNDLSVSICKNPGTYEDYGNARDLLQSQGCTQITYDYPEVYDVDPHATIKFLLDSIYKNAENFDNRGNPKPNTVNDFKATPAAITLGSTVHKYIEQNIGYLNSKNPFLRKRAEQCQKMLELETLSKQKQLEYAQGVRPDAAAPVNVVPPAPGPAPAPGPGPDPAPAPVPAPAADPAPVPGPGADPDAVIVRNPEPPLAAPVEEIRVPQQPAAVVDQNAHERSKDMLTAAQDLGEKLRALSGDLEKASPGKPEDTYFAALKHEEKDVFEPDEIENIQKVGKQIDRIPDLSDEDKQELKDGLKKYVDESRGDAVKHVDLSDAVKSKFDRVIEKADASRNNDLADRVQLLKDRYEEKAPLKTPGPKLGGD